MTTVLFGIHFWGKSHFSPKSGYRTAPTSRPVVETSAFEQSAPLDSQVVLLLFSYTLALKMSDGHDLYGVFIPEESVKEALELSQNGTQKLQPITKRTRYHFFTSIGEHHSACEIVVSPLTADNLPMVAFIPYQRYILCCDEASECEFEKLHQKIYDVFIRPIQWDFVHCWWV